MQVDRDGHNVADVYSATGSACSIAANRISYCFDMRGPSVAMDTACSSALTACHVACQSLGHGDCSMAVVAGVNALLNHDNYIAFSRMSMLSPDGRCKAFDASANGFVRAEGVGAVVLKPLSAAQAEGDKIYAVIRGTAANQDGRTNGITLPSQQAQAALVRQACQAANISPGESATSKRMAQERPPVTRSKPPHSVRLCARAGDILVSSVRSRPTSDTSRRPPASPA